MKITLACLFALACAVAPRKQQPFQQLHTLAGGVWQMKTKKGAVCERWQKINDTEMRSQGFRISGHDTIMQERVQLIQKGNDIFYISTVSNQNESKPVSFRLSEIKGQCFTFANPEHDYPQFIVYDIISPDSLHAWTDGKSNGKDLKIYFYYKRVN
ncbi:MAG TPA: DUF6265 family protein [Chitinophagaceae bacterium]|nr:DUF6265 family protein [Chitinophagaceae bacterium]